MGKKEFAAAAFDPEHKIYIVYVGLVSSNVSPSFSPLELNIHPFRKPQVSGLITKEALTKVPAKYLDFADVFFLDLAFKLPEQTRINNQAIELVNG